MDFEAPVNRCPVPQGILVVIGGSENKGEKEPDNKERPVDFVRMEVLKTFKALINKRNPTIEVITTSSGVAEESFREYKKAFAEIGIDNVNQIHHNSRKEVLEEPMIDRVNGAHAFFFTGGDQLKLTAIYGGSEFLTVLKERYIDSSIVIAGTSAGAMALSTPMIYAGSKEDEEQGGAIKVTTGLEFLRDVCVDTHFVHRGRFVRMAQVIMTNPTSIGLGVEEDTAVIVRNGIHAQVVGTGLVIVIEGFYIQDASIETFAEGKPVTIRDLRVHILADGDEYEFKQINPPHR